MTADRASLNIVVHDTEDSASLPSVSLVPDCDVRMGVRSLYFLYDQVSEEFLETACVPASILDRSFLYGDTWQDRLFWSFFTTVAVLVATLFIRIWNFL
ncbi:MAG: hypothetical protein ACLRS8_06895 [Parabacteroides merdae]